MRCGKDVLEVGELAKDGSRRNDPETDPDTPDRTTEDREDTGTKELVWLISPSIGILSCSRNGHTGGKERTNRIAMGISHAPGVLHARSVKRYARHNEN